jgi:hypothetical protein
MPYTKWSVSLILNHIFLLNQVKMHMNKNMTTLRKVRGDVDLHVVAPVKYIEREAVQ